MRARPLGDELLPVVAAARNERPVVLERTSDMKITASSLSTFPIAGPAPREAVLVLLHDELGRTGVGEAAPMKGFSRDSFAAAVHALHDAASSVGEIDEHADPLGAISAALEPCRQPLDASPTARFAMETALLDLLSQRRGTDIATCLRASSVAPVSPARVVSEGALIESSALIVSVTDAPALVKAGLGAVARGFRTLKVKLRATDEVSLEREIEGLTALRYAAPSLALRLDPNGRWSVPDARRFLARLAAIGPVFVEQPVQPQDLAQLGPCAVPWAADESLAEPCECGCSPSAGCSRDDRFGDERAELQHLSAASGCGAFILKPAVLGFVGALACAKLAARRGLPVVVTHFMDGPVGLAAACELSLSLTPAPLPCGLDPHAGLVDVDPAALPHHVQPARVRATGHLGLGLTPEALASLLQRTAPVWTN
ncbi:MAG: enolase C-terminal domain-like protein [Polyangiaceae bacterium]